jgi:FkbM family methyltransferase
MHHGDSVIKTCFGDYISDIKHRIDMTYDYEVGTIFSFCGAAKKLGVEYFFDIGASIGCYSIFLSRIENIKKIFAFEASPHAFRELSKNIDIQERKNIFNLFELAVSDSDEDKNFCIFSELAGNNRIANEKDTVKTITVKSKPIDKLIQVKNKKIAVKIDVEGHELHVLNGMKNLLSENDCIIQIESLGEPLVSSVKKILSLLGYSRVFVLRDDYIFISRRFHDVFHEIQDIYFTCLQKDLRDLLDLRTKKRTTLHAARELLLRYDYPNDPLFATPGPS